MNTDILSILSIEPRSAEGIAEMTVTRAPYIVQDLVPRNVSTIISGEGESGKSLLTEHMAICVSNGLDWFGRKVEKGLVLIIDQENSPEFDLKPRFFGLREGFRSKGQNVKLGDIVIPELTKRLYIDHDNGMRALATLCELYEPVLIIIDSLGNCMKGDTNSADDMYSAITNLNLLLKDHGAAAILLHHLRKRTDHDNSNGQRLRGSSAIRDSVRSHVAVTKSGDKIKIEHEKSNRTKKSLEPLAIEVSWTLDEDAPDLEDAMIILSETEHIKKGSRQDKRKEQLLSLLDSEGKRTAEVCRLAEERYDMSSNIAKKLYKQLVEEGLADGSKHGIWRLRA